MNKTAKYTLLAVVAVMALGGIYLLDAELFNHAQAASGSGVFDKGQEKGNELAELMRGKIAVTITGLVIAVCGTLMQLGRLSHMIGVRIIIGALIIGSAMGIAEFLYA